MATPPAFQTTHALLALALPPLQVHSVMEKMANEGTAEHTSRLGVDVDGAATMEKQWLSFNKGKVVFHGHTLCF